MSQLRFAGPPRALSLVFLVAWSVIIAAMTVGIVRSCTPKPDTPTIVVAPDGGRAAVAIQERVDAAVERHEETVRVIERTIIVRRDEYETARDAEETAVRSRGRDALAAWLDDFARTVREAPDAGIEAGVAP